MKRLLPIVGILMLGIISMAVTACQEKSPTGQSAAPQSTDASMAQRPTEAAKSGTGVAASQTLELVGTLARSGNTFTLITDSGDYSIANQPAAENLDEMVGKHIKVTATLVEGAEKQDGTHTVDLIHLTEIE